MHIQRVATGLLFLALAGGSLGCGNNSSAGREQASQTAAHSMDAIDHGKQVSKPPVDAGNKKQIEVTIDNFNFSPATLTITAGTEVTWINRDDVPHTATSTSKPKAFDTGTLDTDDKYAHVFSKPGTYEYFCAVHPKMTGQIIVK